MWDMGEIVQAQLLKVDNEEAYDPYDSVLVKMKEPMNPNAFIAALRASISQWRQKGKKCVWIELPINLSNLVHPAVEQGFRFHHAESDYLMLVNWIPRDIPSIIPANASHTVGIGAFVVNNERKVVLVVLEKSGEFRGSGLWKFPTGSVDEGEDLCAAAIREVQEETGIDTEFGEILAFRQAHKSFFTKTDLFFVCMLIPKSFNIKTQEMEIEAAKWMPIEDYAEQTFVKENQQYNLIAKICIERLNEQTIGFTPEAVTRKSGGMTNFVYYLKSRV
ncbi:hypothetical protein SAY86_015234 [Trapa natans]|uniref:Nudix hydrolase domain-containing protein n=1 Tax=Trapa natans TaxID=22666 RepID=A0AAN7KHM5_TRANT|nr:hypothetical protein SAY86_015234 [Trapa natans]